MAKTTAQCISGLCLYFLLSSVILYVDPSVIRLSIRLTVRQIVHLFVLFLSVCLFVCPCVCVLIYILGDQEVTANIYCKLRNLPNTDSQNYSTDMW